VTTHWRFANDVARRFPKLNVDHDALFLKDGPFYTAGGITASVDLALALIEEDYGPRVALAVARELVVFLKRSGGQKQYSEPLEFQLTQPIASRPGVMDGRTHARRFHSCAAKRVVFAAFVRHSNRRLAGRRPRS
jgi:transcriptional regulator GlxA family with amidase domain